MTNETQNGPAGIVADPTPANAGITSSAVDSTTTPAAVTAEPSTPSAPPSNQPGVRTHRERGESEFQPATELNSGPPSEPPLPDHTLRIEYSFRVLGGRDLVADLRSKLDLPLTLTKESLARTDGDVADIIDKIIVAPMLTEIRAYLQQRFDCYADAKTKQTSPEPHAPTHAGIRSPKPPNGAAFAMPEIDARPPLPKPPGSRVWPTGKNGM